MEKIKIVATITAKADCIAQVQEELKKVADGSRAEEGNISYAINVDLKDATKFVVLEEWKSQEAIDFHNKTPHFIALVRALKPTTEGLDIVMLKEIY